LLLVSALLASGCASTAGWSLSDARTCERDAAPRVCVQAEPDYGHVLVLADVDVEMLPGECMTAQVEGHGGGLRIATRDPRDHRHDDWVMVRRGFVTRLVIDPQGRVTATSDRCTNQP
jgi:hypothetical protein